MIAQADQQYKSYKDTMGYTHIDGYGNDGHHVTGLKWRDTMGYTHQKYQD
jgi:hypothetical protein